MATFRIRIFMSILGALCVSSIATATELRVRFQAPEGTSATIEKAELLLVGWGWTDQVALPVNGGSTVGVNFDSPQLRSAVEDRHPIAALLFVHIKDMAPVMSDRFTWPRPGGGPITVSFRSGASTTIAQGAVGEITVMLNRSSARVVRFLDDTDKPVGGLKVSAGVFWASDNHCGKVSGAEPLFTGVTDGEGRLNVPNGDFKYVFDIILPPDADPRYAFTNPDASDVMPPYVYVSDVMPPYVTAYLDQSETVIRVHKEKRSIRLRVYAGDVPFAGAIFSAGMNLGLCGAGWGQAAISDANGYAIIYHFYPMENEIICLANDKEILWRVAAKDFVDDFIEIRLPAAARERPTRFIPCS